jgi:hypothetical protein
MKKMDIEQASALLARYVSNPEHEPVIVTLRGKPLVVVLPVHGADVETVSLSLNPKFNAIIQRSIERQAREGGFSSEEIRREFGLPLTLNRKRTGTDGKPKAKRRKSKFAK